MAEFINDSIRNSVIIPAHLTIRLLRKKMEEAQAQGTRVFVIDGFPRSLDQAHAFEEKVFIPNTIIRNTTDFSRFMHQTPRFF